MENTSKSFQFKEQLKKTNPKFGIFLNSGNSIIAEQLSNSGYDWLLIDTQHGPMDNITLASMISAINNGGALSMVRVGGVNDRNGIQQALDLGADGVLVPYVNTREEAELAEFTCCFYPTQGTRSVYFPQRSMNKKGLLGYALPANKNIIVALQVETASCIKNIDEILSVKGVDIAFLGQNDLCMSMGLYEKYEFPQMYFSNELKEATELLIKTAIKYERILGIFLFGTDRVKEFLDLGFNFVCIGNELHHILTQTSSHLAKLDEITSEKKNWKRVPNELAK